MMTENQLTTLADSFCYNSLSNVRTTENGRYISIVVTNLQSRIVPLSLSGQGGCRFDNIDNIFKKQLPLSVRTQLY